MEQWRGTGGECSRRWIGYRFYAIVIRSLVLSQWTECSVTIVARDVSCLFRMFCAQLVDWAQLGVGKTLLEFIAVPFSDFSNYSQYMRLNITKRAKCVVVMSE